MIRIGTQLTFCSPEKILRKTVVELDEQNNITHIFSLDDGNVELSNTLFFDGILSSDVVSVKQNTVIDTNLSLSKNYQYLDFSDNLQSINIKKTDKPLLLDFGTSSPDKINSLLPYLAPALTAFSIFEIIAACTYYPAVLLGWSTGLAVNHCTRLILWKDTDLVNKKLTVETCLNEMSRFYSAY